MNTVPRYEIEEEIRMNIAEAVALARTGEPEQAIDLLSDIAACIAKLTDAEKFGSGLEKVERLLVFLQRRHISSTGAQVAVRLAAMADIATAPNIIVHSCPCDSSIKQMKQELERIYGKHGMHTLVLDISKIVDFDSRVSECLAEIHAKWRARRCFLGIVCGGVTLVPAIPLFTSVEEAKEYLRTGASGGIHK